MTDIERLKEKISTSGIKFNFIAEKCGLSDTGLRNKVNGKREFTAAEVGIIRDVLNLSLKEVNEIFLQ